MAGASTTTRSQTRLVREAGAGLLEHHDLAEDHQLLEAGRGGEEAAVDRALEDAPGEHLELHDVPDVLVHHRGRVEVHGEEAGEDLGLAAAADGRRASEEPRRLERGRHLDEEDPLAALPGGEGERGADDALAHPALAGEDHEAPREERVEQHPGRA